MDKKMPIKVPLRQMEVWQTDDGRRIEVFKKTGDVKYVHREDLGDSGKVPSFNAPDSLFVGVAQIGTPQGMKEIKFEINAASVEDAFDNYHDNAMVAVEELRKQILQARDEYQKTIVTANENDLNAIDEASKEHGAGNIIIP